MTIMMTEAGRRLVLVGRWWWCFSFVMLGASRLPVARHVGWVLTGAAPAPAAPTTTEKHQHLPMTSALVPKVPTSLPLARRAFC
jgi:hypothetical protein